MSNGAVGSLLEVSTNPRNVSLHMSKYIGSGDDASNVATRYVEECVLNSSMSQNLKRGRAKTFQNVTGSGYNNANNEIGVFMSEDGIPKESLEKMRPYLRESDNKGSDNVETKAC
jgi:hypothetical protein